MSRIRKKMKTMSLHEQLCYIMMLMIIPLLVCMGLVLLVLSIYAYKYAKITHNVNVSSRFNIDFKAQMDLKMYHFAVESKEQEELPIGEVEDAVNLAKSLKKTTTIKESTEAIRNVIDYCENLERRMYALKETKKFTSRKEQLENNIYVLTNLIQHSMMDYIYYEAGYMSSIEKGMTRNAIIMVCILICVVLLIAILALTKSIKFAESITKPIEKLLENVRSVGHGEFSLDAVESDSYEIRNLDEGIQKMADRIKRLLEHVKEEQLLQHKTELMLLQAQVSPHFLYNTLDTIIWLVECEMNEEAVQMITNLSVFFRTMLSSGDDIITLKAELSHTKSYLDIQQVRYRDILSYSITCEEELLSCKIPKLSLQPLVENALYHGVKEKRGKSSINIECKKREGDIEIIVKDNGNGMSKERLSSVKAVLMTKEKKGFGLRAVQERIKLYYGEEYGIHISSQEGIGTEVIIHIPEKNQPIS